MKNKIWQDFYEEYLSSYHGLKKPMIRQQFEDLKNNTPKLGPNPKHDSVNHPKHYTTHPSGIECITITRHMNFNLGNAIKYIWRAGEKGDMIQDLEKAVWYINDEIKRLKS